jgi:hypothetical protein
MLCFKDKVDRVYTIDSLKTKWTPWYKGFLTKFLLRWSRNYLLSWNLKADYIAHKSPPLDSVFSQFNPVYHFTPNFSKIHYDSIFSYMVRFLK